MGLMPSRKLAARAWSGTRVAAITPAPRTTMFRREGNVALTLRGASARTTTAARETARPRLDATPAAREDPEMEETLVQVIVL